MANKDIGQMAKERWANMSEEERKQDIEKRNKSRRKNAYEERQMTNALKIMLNANWNFEDKDGKSVKGSGFEAITTNLIKSALEPQGKNVVSAFKEIRDTIGEKPIDKVEQDNTIEVILPDALKDLFK